MSLRLLLATALAAGACVWSAAAAPLEAYGGLPSIEMVEISPDGSKLAVVTSTGEQRVIGVKTLAGGPTQTASVGSTKIRGLDWVGEDSLIITTSETAGGIAGLSGGRRENFLAYELNLATRKVQRLLEGNIGGAGSTGTIIPSRSRDVGLSLNILAGPPEVWTVDGKARLFLRSYTFSTHSALTVFDMDLRSGKPRVMELGDQFTYDMVLGPAGKAIARTEYDDDSGRWTLKMRQGGNWRTIRTLDTKLDLPSLAGPGRAAGSVLLVEHDESGSRLREVSADGAWSDPLNVHDVNGLLVDPMTHRLIGLHVLAGDEDRYTFFEPADQAAWDSVRAAFKGDRVRLESWSDDRKKVVVLVDSASQGEAYALVDLATKRASWLGFRYQKLKLGDISPVRPVKFKAADGLELSGYLTVPYGAEARNLPLIVFPHGGPASRDEPGFDWWAQAMASRGYAVLQVNFRGSEGFGRPFLEAGFGEFGRKMQTDLSDGVRYLAAQGIADPNRVCIVGASYGGYAALAGAALDAGVYRCAASVAGLSDLGRFVSWSRQDKGRVAFRYWTRFMGAEDDRAAVLRSISPAAHADKVTIPVLLVHGRDDTVVPLEQSRIMAEALQNSGKSVELVVQPGADHWLSRGDTRLQMLHATVGFLEKHNPPN